MDRNQEDKLARSLKDAPAIFCGVNVHYLARWITPMPHGDWEALIRQHDCVLGVFILWSLQIDFDRGLLKTAGVSRRMLVAQRHQAA